ncbi:MAG TPA: hypothetical protein VEA36_01605 [Candidatus Paceibacterota bacterium]|nr:hypothetical protein [Candidatus Paceibacterota bacterium]
MSDGILFLAIFLFFFLLWFVSGGPTRPISFAGPYITPITDVDDTQFAYDSDEPFFSPDFNLFGGTNLQAGDAYANASPLRGQVTISSVTPGSSAKDEYVTLQLSQNAPGPVSISGWRLRSDATYKSATIPGGTELPRRGINRTDPIVLQPGDRATITTGDSPIGVSFRENRCVGYFGTSQNFSPHLSSACPSPLAEFERYYEGNKLADDSCYNYLSALPQCTNPPHRGRPRLTNRCEEFIDEYLDYNGCVAAHQGEQDFRSQEWRIYLERNAKLWKPSREAVRLIDAQGMTVDLYTY